MTQPAPSIGHLIRVWRRRRRLSQFDLACDAGISPKHVSFLETGRAHPVREMLLHLAECMAIPLRDRNVMLRAAGFDPPYLERPLDDPAFRSTRQNIELMLRMHEPNPAMAIDRHWNMAASNNALAGLTAGVDPVLFSPPVNLVRLNLHPAGLAPRIINLPEWRHHLLARLRRQIDTTGDPALLALVEEVKHYPVVFGPVRRAKVRDFETLAVPLRLATVHGPLAFFSTTTVFARPVDITLAELTIEAFFPADTATASALRRLPAELVPIPVAADAPPRAATRTPRLARRAVAG